MIFKAVLGLFLLVGFLNLSVAQQRMPPLTLQDIEDEIEALSSPEEKLRRYIEAGQGSLRNQPDSLRMIASEIANLEGISKLEQDAFSNYILADAWRNVNTDSAIYYAEKAAGNLKKLGEHDSYLSVENLKGLQYNRKRAFVEAERTYLGALSYFQENQNQEIGYPIHFIYGNLGNLYSRVGAYDLAIQMFEKFLEIEDNPVDRCNILNRISNSFAELNKVERARDLLSPCLEFEQLPPPIKATIRANLSKYYEELGEEDISLSLLQEASEISYNNRVPNIAIAQLIRLGQKYLKRDMIQKADSAKNLVLAHPQQRIVPNIEITKFLFFAELELAKEEYEEALNYTKEAISEAKRHNIENELRDVYALQAEAYEGIGELKQAIVLQKKQNTADRMRAEDERVREMSMMSVRLQLQNAQSDLDEANDELRINQVRNISIILLLLLFGSYVIYRYRLHFLLKEEKTRTRIARDLHDDLSGTLSSISFFSEAAQRTKEDQKKSKRFMKMIDKSATEAKEKINDIIWAIDPAKDDWSVFIKKCKRFAADSFDSKEIEYQLEMDNDFNFSVKVEIRQNMWLIFKECISNLVRHSGATKAYVKMTSKGRNVILEVKDNGKGLNKKMKFEGNGIRNIMSRVEAIDGEVHLDSDPDKGTHWHFVFPQF